MTSSRLVIVRVVRPRASSAKLSCGGGELHCHSSVAPPQGLLGARAAAQQRVQQHPGTQKQADAQHQASRSSTSGAGPCNCGFVQCVPPRHAVRAQQELREERQVEADEDQQAGDPAPRIRCTSGRTSWATSSAGRPGTRSACRPSSRNGNGPRRSTCRAGARPWPERARNSPVRPPMPNRNMNASA